MYPDYAGGRVMADSTSMFVVGVYQYYKWTDDKSVLGKLWSAVKRAITWLIIDSTKGNFFLGFCFAYLFLP